MLAGVWLVQNTIVFSSKIGLEVNGAADYITGVHVWFPGALRTPTFDIGRRVSDTEADTG